MEADNIEFLYGDITKVDDEKHVVEGYISSAVQDLAGHIIDQEWLKKTLPAWVADWGNIREMHAQKAVGTVTEADTTTSPGPYIKTQIIDDGAWSKIKAGIYKGFSVGIKNPIVVRDAKAPSGRVVGGDLLEISVVDRPANPLARFVMYKSAASGEITDVQRGLVLEPDIAKADLSADGRRTSAAKGTAESDGSFPIESVTDLKNAVKDWGRAGKKPSDKAHIIKRARALGAASELPKDWLEKTVETDAPATTPEVTGSAEADVAKAAASSKPTHTHPHKGVHNHEHDDMRGGTHTHAHMHDEDDMHDHSHLGGKDARLLTPEQRSEAKSMQRDSYNFTTYPDLTKAAPDVAAVNGAPKTVSPVATLAELETKLAEIRAMIESVADQTDQDRDGDIDFSARDPRDATAQPNQGFRDASAQTPTVVTPEKLALSLSPSADLGAAVPDLVKSIAQIIEQKVDERMETLKAELNTKTDVADVAGVTADVAKFASGIAKGLADLAVGSGAIAKRVADSQVEAQRLSEEIERVKRLAQPVKGQTAQVVDKTIGADVYATASPDLTKASGGPDALETLVKKAREMNDETSRKMLAAEVYKIMAGRQQLQQ